MLVQGILLGFVSSKAALTSSFLMRDFGIPFSPRFCSSVPSPIIPGCVIFGAFERLGVSPLLLIPYTPGRECTFLNSESDKPFRLKRPPTSASALGIMTATVTDLRVRSGHPEKGLLSQLDLGPNLSV